MSPDPGQFWRAASEGTRISTSEGWRDRIGDDWKRHIDLFREGRQPVEEIPCRTPCGYGCHRRVRHRNDGVAWALCLEQGEDAYPLSEEDLEQWELCPDQVAAKVATALARHDGEEGGRAEASLIKNLWRIAWAPIPTWLLLEPGRARWADALTRILTEIQSPGRLLLPTAGMMAPELRRLFEERGWAVAALDDRLEMDDGGDWRFTDRLPQIMMPNPDKLQYAFICRGEGWDLWFDGKYIFITHTKGCYFLAELLAHPDQDFSPLKLCATVAMSDSRKIRQGKIEALDVQARQEMEARLEEVQRELGETSNPADLAELNEEREQLEGELKRAKGIGGKIRNVSDAQEKARGSVGKALEVVFVKIKRFNEDAWRHFYGLIKPTANKLRYPRVPGMDWVVKKTVE